MVAKNDHTGHKIQTKGISKKYENNFEQVFGKKNIKQGKEEAKANAEAVKRLSKEQDCI